MSCRVGDNWRNRRNLKVKCLVTFSTYYYVDNIKEIQITLIPTEHTSKVLIFWPRASCSFNKLLTVCREYHVWFC